MVQNDLHINYSGLITIQSEYFYDKESTCNTQVPGRPNNVATHQFSLLETYE
jgi:hypothetical protein